VGFNRDMLDEESTQRPRARKEQVWNGVLASVGGRLGRLRYMQIIKAGVGWIEGRQKGPGPAVHPGHRVVRWA